MNKQLIANQHEQACDYSCKNTAANASFRYCTATAEASGSRWLREELELLEDLQLAKKAGDKSLSPPSGSGRLGMIESFSLCLG